MRSRSSAAPRRDPHLRPAAVAGGAAAAAARAGRPDDKVASACAKAEEEEPIGLALADHVVVNDELERAVTELQAVIAFAPTGPVTDLALGRIGLGTAPLGNLYAEVTEEDARATVDAAWDAGIRLFDTAPLYGHGLAERRLGAALAAHPRDELVISTKVGRLLRPGVPDPEGAFRVSHGEVPRVRLLGRRRAPFSRREPRAPGGRPCRHRAHP